MENDVCKLIPILLKKGNNQNNYFMGLFSTFILLIFFYNGNVSFMSRIIFRALNLYRQQTLLNIVVEKR